MGTAPQTDTALDSRRNGGKKVPGPATAKRSRRVSRIINKKAQGKTAA